MSRFFSGAPAPFGEEKITQAMEGASKLAFSEDACPEPNEETNRIFEYLPELFQDESEKQYLATLALAVRVSRENGLYQFAYIQYHMLFMAAVYFVLLKLYARRSKDIELALFYLLKDRYRDFFREENTKNRKLYFGSFAAIGESDVFKLFHIVGMDADLEGEIKRLVKERNDYAHANGRLLLTSETFFLKKIRTFNRCIGRVLDLVKDDMLTLYRSVLCDPNVYDSEIRAYLDPAQQVQEEIVRAYSLSRWDLNLCRKFDIRQLADHDAYEPIKELHIALCRYYKALRDEP